MRRESRLGALLLLLTWTLPLHAQLESFATVDWPAAVSPRNELPEERSYSYEINDVSLTRLNEWLSWANLELPVAIDGKADSWLWLQRSSAGWTDFSGYRVEGGIRSPDLKLEGQTISDARCANEPDRI